MRSTPVPAQCAWRPGEETGTSPNAGNPPSKELSAQCTVALPELETRRLRRRIQAMRCHALLPASPHEARGDRAWHLAAKGGARRLHVSPLHERRCRFGGFGLGAGRQRAAGHSTQPEDGRHVHQLLPHHSHHSPSCHHQDFSCSASAPSPCKCKAAKRSSMAATSGSISRSLGWPEGGRSLERVAQRPGGGRAKESADDSGGRGQRDGEGRWAGGARETRGTRAPLKAAWGRH